MRLNNEKSDEELAKQAMAAVLAGDPAAVKAFNATRVATQWAIETLLLSIKGSGRSFEEGMKLAKEQLMSLRSDGELKVGHKEFCRRVMTKALENLGDAK